MLFNKNKKKTKPITAMFSNKMQYVVLFSFALMVLGLFMQIIVTNNVALKGNEFTELRTKKAELQKEIAVLSYDDSNLTSISYLTTKAVQLGFVQNTSELLAISQLPSSSIAVATSRL